MIELNHIYNEDCLEGMKRIPDGSVDLVVTDPPYLISYKSGRRHDKSHKFCHVIANDDNANFIGEYAKECFRILKDNSAMYMFCSPKKVDVFMDIARSAGFAIKNSIVWVKNNFTAGDLKAQFAQKYELILLLNKGRALFNGKRINDEWEFARVSGQHLLHQNQKPVPLIEQCIIKHSQSGGGSF